MANERVIDLTGISSATNNDVFLIEDSESGETRKIKMSELVSSILPAGLSASMKGYTARRNIYVGPKPRISVSYDVATETCTLSILTNCFIQLANGGFYTINAQTVSIPRYSLVYLSANNSTFQALNENSTIGSNVGNAYLLVADYRDISKNTEGLFVLGYSDCDWVSLFDAFYVPIITISSLTYIPKFIGQKIIYNSDLYEGIAFTGTMWAKVITADNNSTQMNARNEIKTSIDTSDVAYIKSAEFIAPRSGAFPTYWVLGNGMTVNIFGIAVAGTLSKAVKFNRIGILIGRDSANAWASGTISVTVYGDYSGTGTGLTGSNQLATGSIVAADILKQAKRNLTSTAQFIFDECIVHIDLSTAVDLAAFSKLMVVIDSTINFKICHNLTTSNDCLTIAQCYYVRDSGIKSTYAISERPAIYFFNYDSTQYGLVRDLDTMNKQITSTSERINHCLYYNSDVYKAIPTFMRKWLLKENNILNVVLYGDSISNFQNISQKTDRTCEPLGLHGNSIGRQLWRIFNYGVFTQEGVEQIADPITSYLAGEQGNMRFIRADHATKAVKTGTFITNNNTVFGTLGGYNEGSNSPYYYNHVYFFTKNQDEYIEFTVDKNAIGFSLVYLGSNTNLNDGAGNNLAACNDIEVKKDGFVIDNVNAVTVSGAFNQLRKDYTLTPQASDFVIRVTNKASNKWMGVWGVEYWTGKCVRVINTALAGNHSQSLYANINNCVIAQNPDLVIYEIPILNDNYGLTLDNTIKYEYDTMKAILDNNIEVVAILPHARSEYTPNASATLDPALALDDDDPSTRPNFYPASVWAARKVCATLNIPVIDMYQKFLDYAGNTTAAYNALLVDTVHLAQPGIDLYNSLLKEVFRFEKTLL